MNLTGPWTTAETESFLESATVPIRLAVHTTSGRLWMLSLWYRYRDGRLECATSANADVVRKLRANDEVAFEISTNDPPYKGVRGNGTASIDTDEGKAVLRALIERYLGDTDSDLAAMLLEDGREEVRITIEPDRLATWDFTERMGDVSG